METPITPDYAKSLTGYTEGFLCDLKDNIYNIKFLKFKVRDMDSGFVLFEVNDDGEKEDEQVNGEINGESNGDSNSNETNNNARTIRYHLGPDFLELRNIGSALTFSVGSLPVKNLLMVERHYFKDKLIKSFEFKFDFCIPNSTNTWETIYEIPELDQDLKEEMINCPWDTKSDSFYFVENKLIMHHKAIYNYSPLD